MRLLCVTKSSYGAMRTRQSSHHVCGCTAARFFWSCFTGHLLAIASTSCTRGANRRKLLQGLANAVRSSAARKSPLRHFQTQLSMVRRLRHTNVRYTRLHPPQVPRIDVDTQCLRFDNGDAGARNSPHLTSLVRRELWHRIFPIGHWRPRHRFAVFWAFFVLSLWCRSNNATLRSSRSVSVAL